MDPVWVGNIFKMRHDDLWNFPNPKQNKQRDAQVVGWDALHSFADEISDSIQVVMAHCNMERTDHM
jgi:hypothetical protein